MYSTFLLLLCWSEDTWYFTTFSMLYTLELDFFGKLLEDSQIHSLCNQTLITRCFTKRKQSKLISFSTVNQILKHMHKLAFRVFTVTRGTHVVLPFEKTYYHMSIQSCSQLLNQKEMINQTNPLLISTDFLKYPFRHSFQTGLKFSYKLTEFFFQF